MKEDFGILYGSYEQVSFPNKKFGLDGECFPSFAAKICKEAEKAYELAGVDVSKIKEMGAPKQASLKEACSKPELLSLAKSAYVFFKLKERGVSHVPPYDVECKGERFEGRGIGIMVKFNEWIFIKKLSPQAEAYEVAGLLASANEKVLEKMHSTLLGRDVQENRRVGKLDEVVKQLEDAYNDSYFKYLEMALSYKGFRPYPFLQAMVKAYPDLKPKKPRGRLPK